MGNDLGISTSILKDSRDDDTNLCKRKKKEEKSKTWTAKAPKVTLAAMKTMNVIYL